MATSTKKQKKQATRKLKLRPIDIVVFALTVVLVAFGVWSMQTRQSANAGPCAKPGQEHQLTLNGDAFSVSELKLNQCDTIKIANLDPVLSYQIAFGVHERHVVYPGFSELVLRPNEFITVDAVQAGDYRIHDHIRDKAAVNLEIRALVGK